jgi:hypothetical protein
MINFIFLALFLLKAFFVMMAISMSFTCMILAQGCCCGTSPLRRSQAPEVAVDHQHNKVPETV